MLASFLITHKRHVLIAMGILAALLLLRLWVFWANVQSPLNLTEAYFLDVGNGATLTRLLHQLESEDILKGADDVVLYARATGLASRIKAGEYELVAGITSQGLLELLASGRVTYHRLKLIEGWTLRQALQAIQDDPSINVVLDVNDPDALREAFGTDSYPEGLFFPDTYNFTKGTTDLELLQRAHKLMEETLQQSWAGRAAGLPYKTPYEALVMASIVEKESALPQERSLIAGVFIRRLQIDMKLQTDPTVIYGVGADFDGNLTRAHLQQDTPWNTYTRTGLPATPIALPGLGAIEASLHPDASEYLYFVARGDGSHYFSTTLEEHNQAVREYQLEPKPL